MSKMEFAPIIKKLLFLSLLVSVVGCAEIGPPPGGEVDKVKPRIIASSPVNGSTLVEIGNSITISFSERIIKPLSKRPIYISPRLKSEPKIQWKSDKVIITLADSFEVNQTYIISFADGIQDQRRNPLDSGSIIAFTTGEKLANGVIGGTVVDENQIAQNNIVTALYKKDAFDTAAAIDSLYPTYMVVTDAEGNFSFRYIPNGEYVLLAFLDKNKNERLDTKTEKYGLTDRSITLDSSLNNIQNLNITLTAHDESQQIIIAVRQTNNNLFQIDFNQNLLNQQRFDIQKVQLNLKKYTSTATAQQQEFILPVDSSSAHSIFAYFGKLPEGLYKLSYDNNDSLIIFDSVLVKEIVDKSSPTIKLFQPPANKKTFKDSLHIQIQFSEPIDSTHLTKESFYFIDNDSNLVFPEFEFINPSLCRLSNNFLKDNLYQYRLRISEFDITDLAGNNMGDSTTIKLINLINPDSLGVIQGSINIAKQFSVPKSIVLLFKNISTNQLFTHFSNDNSFNLQLPQGKYVFSGFLDSNNNKTRDYGALFPLQYAEPFVNYPDTVNVRARFESTDILLEFK